MEAVWIAVLSMLSAVLIVNLGLGDAIAEVSGKILKCPTCLSFWGALAALLYNGTEIIIAVSLSILVAYLSNFVGIVLMMLNRLYTWLYGKETNQNRNETDGDGD
ncbi:MAG: hypothetical protein K2K82_00975 [Muribaculaceae bacterium]|nr:hypothetical protein [Muribaculaceae bacterium]